jgi:hypothetical protein
VTRSVPHTGDPEPAKDRGTALDRSYWLVFVGLSAHSLGVLDECADSTIQRTLAAIGVPMLAICFANRLSTERHPEARTPFVPTRLILP